jgi:Fe-S-cluster containining protein
VPTRGPFSSVQNQNFEDIRDKRTFFTMTDRLVTANIELASPDWEMRFQVGVPGAPIAATELLPLAQNLSNAIVDATVREIETRGGKISCCKGCGACCRQLVPISEVEARYIAELVESLPEPRRSKVKARFEDAVKRLAEVGLLEKLRQPECWYREEYREFGLEYFHQAIPCPFLEEECCSIYPERPITCREFLVTTPAKNCQNPSTETIRSVKLPMHVGPALAKLGTPEDEPSEAHWVPLVLALEWVVANPKPPPSHSGPDLLGELMRHLTGKELLPSKGSEQTPK